MSLNEELNATTGPGKISRRTLAVGAAWSVPVIAAASAAPAMAASTPVIIDWSASSACKIPGNSQGGYCYDKGYVLWAKFTNSLAQAVTINITGMVVGGVAQCIVGVVKPTTSCSTAVSPLVVPAGGSVVFGIFCNASTDSSSTTVTVNFTYTTGGPAIPATTSHSLTGGSWANDSGGGSCAFPPGSSCTAPLTACSTPCATA